MNIRLSDHWGVVQGELFPTLKKREDLEVLSEKHERLIMIIEFVSVEKHVRRSTICGPGRPEHDRQNMACVFIAKAVYGIEDTKAMIDLLKVDRTLRRICGYSRIAKIPSEATFSRAFAEFAEGELPARMHEGFIKKYHADRIIGHIGRDSTALEARESAVKKPKPSKEATEPSEKKRKRGRPKKGEVVEKKTVDETRIERQRTMDLKEMVTELPTACDIGTKKNSNGYKISWKGYKVHIDTADGDIPISALLTSASVHDSQVAIPLNQITSQRVSHCYELMDAAYDAKVLRDYSASKGHVALIDFNKRSSTDERKFEKHEAERYKKRSGSERVNSQLKDNYGMCGFHVRGHKKVFAHVMFSVLCLAIEQSIRLLT